MNIFRAAGLRYGCMLESPPELKNIIDACVSSSPASNPRDLNAIDVGCEMVIRTF